MLSKWPDKLLLEREKETHAPTPPIQNLGYFLNILPPLAAAKMQSGFKKGL